MTTGFGPVLVALLVAQSSAAWDHPDPAPWWPLQVSQTAPGFRLEDTSLHPWSLALGQAVWISFGASWCPWCERQERLMVETARRYSDLTVVEVDEERHISKAERWQEGLGANLPLSFHMLLDPNFKVARRYRVQAYPTSFFIGPSGRIRAVYLGALTTRRALLSCLKPLMRVPTMHASKEEIITKIGHNR